MSYNMPPKEKGPGVVLPDLADDGALVWVSALYKLSGNQVKHRVNHRVNHRERVNVP
jgi:hypothetical protein